MESISVFDMLSIGVGPSSSHTLGPWRAAKTWIEKLQHQEQFTMVSTISVELYGSLALTGKGHATDIAVLMGLLGSDPVSFPIDEIPKQIENIKASKILDLNSEKPIPFVFNEAILFNRTFLDFHPNGIAFNATLRNGKQITDTYYSIGGGFVVQEEMQRAKRQKEKFSAFPFPIEKATQILEYCNSEGITISELVLKNELSLRSPDRIDDKLKAIWRVMLDSMYTGCHTEGILPGGLNVIRRAYETHEKLKGDSTYTNPNEWISAIRDTEVKFRQILKWVSCFALAVNEVNASLGRVVTAPTNGSAGVIPSVLMYYLVIENHDGNFDDIKKFLLVAGEIGSLFKKGATISAAMGGCQAEIGVSSAMAAGALTELMGGSPEQVLIAAEIAMEHHLGLTCDPIGGLVQIPCIERNAMGAIKAINACEMALDRDPKDAKIPLDKVIATMWETAKDMASKYKETSEGGLAVQVNMADC
ncbi:L-serine ammonia-lyase [Winogradskyella immobilis]|uniref:L-serine dehydratase n=1 Tax=Winogradskyella immobilis TaxID=2816852 RepID=A0ABS8EKX7_9FLAO|nr:L-serine ammonia-lyase [Winogradskyella immobilis]MCC1483681.1 L-serine ammonia-lyase [Winogradskyella immobilis]MCG0015775.1 L-serine ammonia-lyase [Winogradskyella immobilis]